MDEVRKSKRIISVAAGLAALSIAGFWVARGDAHSEQRATRNDLTIEEPMLSDKQIKAGNFPPGFQMPQSIVERMTTHFKLSDAQVKKAQAIVDQYSPRIRELRDLGADDDAKREEAIRLRTERNKQLSTILTPEQHHLLPSFSWRRPMGMFPRL